MNKLVTAFLLAVVLGSGAILLTSCGVNESKAKRVLAAQGMTDIEIGGYSFWGCGKDDSFRSNFTAKGSNGQNVTGVICGGFLKGYTVRFD